MRTLLLAALAGGLFVSCETTPPLPAAVDPTPARPWVACIADSPHVAAQRFEARRHGHDRQLPELVYVIGRYAEDTSELMVIRGAYDPASCAGALLNDRRHWRG